MTSRIETGIPSQCVQTVAGDQGRPAGGRDTAWAPGARSRWWAARRSRWFASHRVRGARGEGPTRAQLRPAQSPTIKDCGPDRSVDLFTGCVGICRSRLPNPRGLHHNSPRPGSRFCVRDLDFSLSHAKEWREQRAYLEKRLTVLTARCGCPWDSDRLRAEAGVAGRLDCLLCDRAGYDLMVMGTHGRRGLRMCLSGIAGAMLRYALCPVLTVHRSLATVGALSTCCSAGRVMIFAPLQRESVHETQREETVSGEFEPTVASGLSGATIELPDGMGADLAESLRALEEWGCREGYALQDWLDAEAVVMEEIHGSSRMSALPHGRSRPWRIDSPAAAV